jgi:uncharacterized protein YndB with AHSA1/START domain
LEANDMPSAHRTIVIHRSPDEVFEFFANPDNDRAWRPHVKEISASGPLTAGALVHQLVEGPGGRGIAADFQVTAYDRPNRYAFRVVAGPARPIGEFTFAPSGSGTEVAFSLQAELSGWKRFLMSRPVQASMDGEMAGLDRAKALIEKR